MSGRLAVPVGKLHRSDKLLLEQLALVETLGIGYHAVERAAIRPGESVLVVGAGPIGLSVVEFARRSGGRVRVLDVNPRRRAFVAERWDVEAIAEPDGTLADVVIDATGSAKAMEASFDLVAFGGRLVFVGIVLDRISFADTLFHRREMTVVASRNSHNAFPDIIRRIESGEIDTRPWITHRLALADVPDEFPSLPEAAGLVKAMVEVSDADV